MKLKDDLLAYLNVTLSEEERKQLYLGPKDKGAATEITEETMKTAGIQLVKTLEKRQSAHKTMIWVISGLFVLIILVMLATVIFFYSQEKIVQGIQVGGFAAILAALLKFQNFWRQVWITETILSTLPSLPPKAQVKVVYTMFIKFFK